MIGRSYFTRTIFGLVGLVIVLVLGFYGTRFAQGAFADDYRVSVNLGETGQGIIAGSDVVARGVIVGEVGAIELNDDLQAVVELVLENKYTIPSDAIFAVTGKTLLGEKQIEIRFDGSFDADNAIADGTMINDSSQVVELQDVLQELDELFGAINPDELAIVVNDGLGAFVGQEDNIGRAIDQGARATGVFTRSLDDQIPALRDLSLVAEALGPRGEDFNRLGTVIDGGALRTITDNQVRIERLLDSLNSFSDEFDLVLELTRPDLDRLIIQGDNVTRLLFTYRPEFADLIVGVRDYTDTIGNGGLTDPGFVGFGAGFQIIAENPITAELCADAPPELLPLIPICEDAEPSDAGADPSAEPSEPGGEPAPPGVPDIPDPAALLEIPVSIDASPELPQRAGIEGILDGIMSFTTPLAAPEATGPIGGSDQ